MRRTAAAAAQPAAGGPSALESRLLRRTRTGRPTTLCEPKNRSFLSQLSGEGELENPPKIQMSS